MTKQQIVPVIVVALSVFFLTACAGLSSQATVEQEMSVESQATATPEAVAVDAVATEVAVPKEAILVPTVEPSPEPESEETDWTQTAGIDGDYYVLGNPAAPIRLIDFSDFM